MIHSFSCTNFYSFKKEAFVSFAVNEKAPQNDGYFTAPSGTRLSKIETVIGPNASGKTNVLKVLPFLKWIIIDSFNTNPSTKIPVKPFILKHHEDLPIEFFVEFEINGDIYIYNFTLNSERILGESLKIKNKTKEKITTKTIFKRDWNAKNNLYMFDGKKLNLPKGFENLLRANASVIGTAMRLNHKKSQEIGKFWQNLETNVVEAGWTGVSLLPNANISLIEALHHYSENKTLKKEAEKILSRFDLGFESFDIKKEKKENTTSIDLKVIHSFGKEKYPVPFQYQSAGTKQLFVILKPILQALAHGGIAVLDELDANLHPDMVLALFELFTSPETNPKNAQILFSTHSHRILGELDKYQITLTEKNDKGESEIWRLDEMTGVRADDNYYAKYIAGSYGAIPKIY